MLACRVAVPLVLVGAQRTLAELRTTQDWQVRFAVAKADGVASWEVTKTIAEKAVKTSYKPADLAAAGVTSIVVPADASDVKVVKGYSKV